MRLTDRRTEKIYIARPRLHFIQQGKNLGRTFFSFVTIYTFDGQRDRQTA